MRMARSRTSGENLFVVLLIMAPLSQKLEPPANPVRFRDRVRKLGTITKVESEGKRFPSHSVLLIVGYGKRIA